MLESDDTKIVMVGNLFWNGGVNLLVVYHGKAMLELLWEDTRQLSLRPLSHLHIS